MGGKAKKIKPPTWCGFMVRQIRANVSINGKRKNEYGGGI
jgi:hypothetical protein